LQHTALLTNRTALLFSVCREDHRQLLRKLFALVVRGSAAVQALHAAMQQPMRAAAYPAGGL
jgi:hypothetical protein